MRINLPEPLLLATTNPGKLRELRALLDPYGIKLVDPRQAGLPDLQVDETGSTYLENATLKALAFLAASGLASLADDSGLEVDALDGEPGLRSARYSPVPGADDRSRRRQLLGRLASCPQPWSARFQCTLAVALPDGGLISASGTCEGLIVPDERGAGGFGYDPIFFFPEIGKTMAELDLPAKNEISHRADAIHALFQP